jgi:release factor glutamine methyltransferase
MQPTIQYIRNELQPFYPKNEIEGFIKLIFSHLKNYSLTDLVLKREEKLDTEDFSAIREMVERLKLNEPIHYIIGTTEFYGLRLNVNPSVLIPRPETEELVDWIVKSETAVNSVLDIGTGSGCIALTLKKILAETTVRGCDISDEALNVARSNAALNNLEVGFFMADILQWSAIKWPSKFDLIVSNPPYVTDDERHVMNVNVTGYEPHKALFVPDDNPLKFYSPIVQFASEWLNCNGKLYFEINEMFGKQVAGLLQSNGFTHVEIKKDLQGKERMVRGTWPGSEKHEKLKLK